MARPCKAAGLLADQSHSAELSERKGKEDKLKGNNKPPTPPKWLTKEQKAIFRFIVNELKGADILCKIDKWILQECVIAIDSLDKIGQAVNADKALLYDKQVLSAKEKYTKIFFRCCNELSLSPQSRAKIANISTQGDDGLDLLRKIISGDYEE